jgi:cytochrome c-type biogenesis protein CcmF
MTPLIGRVLVLGALGVATVGSILGFASGKMPHSAGVVWARRCALAFSLLIIGANLAMVQALVSTDLSVGYVTQVGARSLPLWVKVVSLWSSLDGSILFWGLVLGIYIAGATVAMGKRHPEYLPGAIGVWLACGTFFAFLIAGPAQPFTTVTNPPLDGPGPNPLLQNHMLMAIHPPFLYFGYVGMTIPFGIVSAALLCGKLGRDVLRPLRTWLLLPWTFQTIAIVLGGWWAYEVLGWGGYWSWDPVENASFLPWLTGTAALHSMVVTERRGTLKGWTATLVMSTFLLTILGTFMTRSGVFNSVHSFTQSAIGPTILSFLAIAVIWTVGLLAARIDAIESSDDVGPAAGREGAFLVNNLLFVLLTMTVLIGTVFPLIVEATTNRQISVGRPYFDRMAMPIGVALLFLLGVGPALPWGRATKRQLRTALVPPLVGAALLAITGWVLHARNPWTVVTFAFGGYAAQVTLSEMWRPLVQRLRNGVSFGDAFVDAQLRRGRRRFGSYIVHAGAVLIMIAIAVSSTMQVSEELHMKRDQSAPIGPYTLTFVGVKRVSELNRDSIVAEIGVAKAGSGVGTLEPRMNYYPMSREPIGTPAVRTTVGSDLYLSILNLDAQGQDLTLHAFINPMVGWIWIATFIMAFGAVVSIIPSRRAIGAALVVPVQGGVGPSGSGPSSSGPSSSGPREAAAEGRP